MKEILAYCFTGIVIFGTLCCSIVKCWTDTMQAINACIEKTGKPLECQATFRGAP